MVYRHKLGSVKTLNQRVFSLIAAIFLFVGPFFGTAAVLWPNEAEATTVSTPSFTERKVYQEDDFAVLGADKWTYWIDSEDPERPDLTASANYAITAHPGSTSQNNGVVKLVASGGQKFNLATSQYSGIKLADITSLGFDLLTDNPSQSYLNLDINFSSWEHGPGLLYHGRLIYMPQSVTANKWGSHEAVASNGTWQWSRFDEYGSKWPDGVTTPGRTWDDIINKFPNAIISNVQFHLVLGEPLGGLYLRADGDAPVTAYYDNVYLTTSTKNTRYNFELKTPDPANANQLTLSGTVFHNRNGDRDQDAGEETLKNWTVRAYKEDESGAWQPVGTATTRPSDNKYAIRQYEAGIYHVCLVKQAGWEQVRQDWSGTPYHTITENLSGMTDEAAWCSVADYGDTADKSNAKNFGVRDIQRPTGAITYSGGQRIDDVIYLQSINDLSFEGTFADNYDLARTTYVVWQVDKDFKNRISGGYCGGWSASSLSNDTLSGITDSVSRAVKDCGSGQAWADGYYEIGHRVYDASGLFTGLNQPTQKFVIDSTPPTWDIDPVHIAPADNAEVTLGSEIIMQWSTATDGNGVNYFYNVSATGNGTTGDDNHLVDPFWPPTFGPFATPELNATGTALGTYHWQVKACDDLGNCTPWTAPWTGSVVNAAAAFTNNTPLNLTGGGSVIAPLSVGASIPPITITGFTTGTSAPAVDAPESDDTGDTLGENIEEVQNNETGSVAGASDFLADNAAKQASGRTFGLLGIAWYWIAGGLATTSGLWWLLAGRRRRKEEEAQI